MNPIAILRSWFSDPDYIETVAYSTLASLLLAGLILTLQALS